MTGRSSRSKLAAVVRDSGAAAAEDVRHRQWSVALAKALATLGRSEADAAAAQKSERWKLAIATWMRETTQARNAWLSVKLNLGTPPALSRNLSVFARHRLSCDPDLQRLRTISAS